MNRDLSLWLKMSEEEKEEYETAIANGKDIIKVFEFPEGSIAYYEIYSMINLIEKQQKEMEELKQDYQILKDDMEWHKVAYIDTPEFEEKFISKDKIREKMNEIMNYTISSSEERHCQNYAYDRLKELLGENYD